MAGSIEDLARLSARIFQHVARIIPAAGLYSSGLMMGLRLTLVDRSLTIIILSVLTLSIIVVVLARLPMLQEANFGSMALILAVLNFASLCLDPIHDIPVLDKARLYLWNYVMMSSSLAAGVSLCYRIPQRLQRSPDMPLVEDEEPSAKGSYKSDSTRFVMDGPPESLRLDVCETLSNPGSVVFKHMPGPSSHCSSISSGASTTISLSAGDRRVDGYAFALHITELSLKAQVKPDSERNDSTWTQEDGEEAH